MSYRRHLEQAIAELRAALRALDAEIARLQSQADMERERGRAA